MTSRSFSKASFNEGAHPDLSTTTGLNKTPNTSIKTLYRRNLSQAQATPGSSKQPKIGLRRREITPSRNPNFIGIGDGDRYIPNRSQTQFEYANHLLVHHNSQGESLLNLSNSAPTSPSKMEKNYKLNLMKAKSANEVGFESDRIFCYRSGKTPRAPLGCKGQQKIVYSVANILPSSMSNKGLRHIASRPDRILDAPNLLDDYYINQMDWAYHNALAVSLAYNVYLWNAETGSIENMFELENQNRYISSVKWASEGSFLAVGFSDGQVKLFDPTRGRRSLLRTMQLPVSSRVPTVSWRKHILTAGTQGGNITVHDVRVAEHLVGTMVKHTQEVCGLTWSPDESLLVSGGGDNLVVVWDHRTMMENSPRPLYVFDEHLASVKAIAFDPFKSKHLATGGGTSDRTVKFWNLMTGTLCSSAQMESQVNSIVYSTHYKEMATGHGYPGNAIKIWKIPSMNCIKTLTSHTDRVLSMSSSPCGEYVMSASADETLQLWHCFACDKETKKENKRRTALQQFVR